ncbi:MAG: hypothetical protein HYS26_00725 [Candidatus Kaiserbacteria bacterium]|nr:MAG: hypothetical protein HYS26_00725 [Candidatus Kaiserbacteria bacterium]
MQIWKRDPAGRWKKTVLSSFEFTGIAELWHLLRGQLAIDCERHWIVLNEAEVDSLARMRRRYTSSDEGVKEFVRNLGLAPLRSQGLPLQLVDHMVGLSAGHLAIECNGPDAFA